jgi:hypothetical protein
MDLTGTLPWQPPHIAALLAALQRYGSVLDASDTGTGKTFCILIICLALGITPLVVGPKAARAGWEDAGKILGVEFEYVNYERCRPRLIKQTEEEFTANGFNDKRESEWTIEVPWGKGSFVKWRNSYEMVIFDEAHRLGGTTSLNSKLGIAAKRQAKYVVALSATAADDPRQMKALGYILGIHGLNTIKCETKLNWMNWLLRHGVKPGHFGGWAFTPDEEKQKKSFSKLHSEIFPRHGSRMLKSRIPGFPLTEILVKMLDDETGKAKKLSEELHELNEEGGNQMAATQHCRQGLEKLMIPHFAGFAEDSVAQGAKVVFFLNFTDPLFELYEKLKKEFGHSRVGYISGRQTGLGGESERRGFVSQFQRNKLDALVVNIFAGGESVNLHDEIDKVPRDTYSAPCESGKQYKQLLGRVNRAGGGFSNQFLCYFAGTRQEIVADRMRRKGLNIELFNDANLDSSLVV